MYMGLGKHMLSSNVLTSLHKQGYHRLKDRFPGILSCTEERFIQAVTDMKVTSLPPPASFSVGPTTIRLPGRNCAAQVSLIVKSLFSDLES